MDYRNNWNWWMHQFWSALATNPSYYYYYTAKTALLNQSIMVRKSGAGATRVSRRAVSSAPSTERNLRVGTVITPFGKFEGDPNKPEIHQNDCPQCKVVFNGAGSRPVQDCCGHVKCRSCFIRNEDGCEQCKEQKIMHRIAEEEYYGALERKAGENQSSDSNHMPFLSRIVEADSRGRRCRRGRKIHSALEAPYLSGNEPGSSTSTALTNGISSSKDYQPTIDFSTIQEITAPTVDPIYSSELNCKPEFGLSEYPLSEDPLMNNDYSSRYQNHTNSSSSFLRKPTTVIFNSKSWTDTNLNKKSSRNDPLDISTPNHSANHVGPSTSKGLVTRGQLKELPPDSTTICTRQNLKRKSSKDSMTPSPVTNSKILRTSSPSTKPDLNKSKSPSSKKPSTSASPSLSSDLSPSRHKLQENSKSTPKFFRLGPQDREEKKNAAIANTKLNKNAVDKKGSLRQGSNKIKPGSSGTLKVVESLPSTSSAANKGKPSRLSSLRSSTSFNNDDEQPSSSSQHRTALSTKTNASVVGQKSNLLTVTATTSSRSPIKGTPTLQLANSIPPKLPISSPSTFTSPKINNVLSPSEAKAGTTVSKINKPSGIPTPPGQVKKELSTPLSSSSTATTTTTTSPEVKKKKKRSPVLIHDHITILQGEPPMYQCNVCMKKFKTKAHIKYHEFCQNGEKPFKCEQCGQGFIAKSHFEYHLRTHTGERPYVCPKCGKGFNQRGKVTRHMRSHTGEKPFACTQCGRAFANAQALRSHFLIHTGERPFACQYCNKRFTGMTNLKKHVITHTGERPYTCPHCLKSFGLKWTLDLHLRTHSSERPYACDQCTRAFSNSKDLRRHLVIHSGERPFKCWICGTAFRRKDNLDRHIKNTHNQPKEVAKQLANEAAAEYLALTKSKNNQQQPQTLTQTQPQPQIQIQIQSQQSKQTPQPTINKITVVRTLPENTAATSSLPVKIPIKVKTVERPKKLLPTIVEEQPTSASSTKLSEPSESYILPNNQTDIPKGSLQFEYTIDNSNLQIACVDVLGLTELQPISAGEYQNLEGINAADTNKPAGPEEETDVTSRKSLERDERNKSDSEIAESIAAAVHTLDAEAESWGSDSLHQHNNGHFMKKESESFQANNGLLLEEESVPLIPMPGRLVAEGSHNEDPEVNITVVYDPDGTTHFIAAEDESRDSSDDKCGNEEGMHVLGLPSEMSSSFEPFLSGTYDERPYSPAEDDATVPLMEEVDDSYELSHSKKSPEDFTNNDNSPDGSYGIAEDFIDSLSKDSNDDKETKSQRSDEVHSDIKIVEERLAEEGKVERETKTKENVDEVSMDSTEETLKEIVNEVSQATGKEMPLANVSEINIPHIVESLDEIEEDVTAQVGDDEDEIDIPTVEETFENMEDDQNAQNKIKGNVDEVSMDSTEETLKGIVNEVSEATSKEICAVEVNEINIPTVVESSSENDEDVNTIVVEEMNEMHHKDKSNLYIQIAEVSSKEIKDECSQITPERKSDDLVIHSDADTSKKRENDDEVGETAQKDVNELATQTYKQSKSMDNLFQQEDLSETNTQEGDEIKMKLKDIKSKTVEEPSIEHFNITASRIAAPAEKEKLAESCCQLNYEDLDDISDNELPQDDDSIDEDEESCNSVDVSVAKEQSSTESKEEQMKKSFLNDVSCILSGSLSKLMETNNFSTSRPQKEIPSIFKTINSVPENGETSCSSNFTCANMESSANFSYDSLSLKLNEVFPSKFDKQLSSQFEEDLSEKLSEESNSKSSNEDLSMKLSNEDVSLKLCNDDSTSSLSVEDSPIKYSDEPLMNGEIDDTLEEGELIIAESLCDGETENLEELDMESETEKASEFDERIDDIKVSSSRDSNSELEEDSALNTEEISSPCSNALEILEDTGVESKTATNEKSLTLSHLPPLMMMENDDLEEGELLDDEEVGATENGVRTKKIASRETGQQTDPDPEFGEPLYQATIGIVPVEGNVSAIAQEVQEPCLSPTNSSHSERDVGTQFICPLKSVESKIQEETEIVAKEILAEEEISANPEISHKSQSEIIPDKIEIVMPKAESKSDLLDNEEEIASGDVSDEDEKEFDKDAITPLDYDEDENETELEDKEKKIAALNMNAEPASPDICDFSNNKSRKNNIQIARDDSESEKEESDVEQEYTSSIKVSEYDEPVHHSETTSNPIQPELVTKSSAPEALEESESKPANDLSETQISIVGSESEKEDSDEVESTSSKIIDLEEIVSHPEITPGESELETNSIVPVASVESKIVDVPTVDILEASGSTIDSELEKKDIDVEQEESSDGVPEENDVDNEESDSKQGRRNLNSTVTEKNEMVANYPDENELETNSEEVPVTSVESKNIQEPIPELSESPINVDGNEAAKEDSEMELGETNTNYDDSSKSDMVPDKGELETEHTTPVALVESRSNEDDTTAILSETPISIQDKVSEKVESNVEQEETNKSVNVSENGNDTASYSELTPSESELEAKPQAPIPSEESKSIGEPAVELSETPITAQDNEKGDLEVEETDMEVEETDLEVEETDMELEESKRKIEAVPCLQIFSDEKKLETKFTAPLTFEERETISEPTVDVSETSISKGRTKYQVNESEMEESGIKPKQTCSSATASRLETPDESEMLSKSTAPVDSEEKKSIEEPTVDVSETPISKGRTKYQVNDSDMGESDIKPKQTCSSVTGYRLETPDESELESKSTAPVDSEERKSIEESTVELSEIPISTKGKETEETSDAEQDKPGYIVSVSHSHIIPDENELESKSAAPLASVESKTIDDSIVEPCETSVGTLEERYLQDTCVSPGQSIDSKDTDDDSTVELSESLGTPDTSSLSDYNADTDVKTTMGFRPLQYRGSIFESVVKSSLLNCEGSTCDFDFSGYYRTVVSREMRFGRISPVNTPKVGTEMIVPTISSMRPKQQRELSEAFDAPEGIIELPPQLQSPSPSPVTPPPRKRRRMTSRTYTPPLQSAKVDIRKMERQDVRDKKRKLEALNAERSSTTSYSAAYEDVRSRGLIYSQASTSSQNTTNTSPSSSTKKYFLHPKMSDLPPGTEIDPNCGVQFICDDESFTCPINPANIHFVRSNGEQHMMETDTPFGEDVQVLYAAAAATMDPQVGNTGPPAKLRLLYAEAIGIQKPNSNESDESNQHLQLYYAATTPNQDIGNTPNPHIRLDHPRLINAGEIGEGQGQQLQVVIAPPHSNYIPNAAPLPVEVSYNGNTAVAQSVVRKDENISLISRARAMHHWYPSITSHADYHIQDYSTTSLSAYQQQPQQQLQPQQQQQLYSQSPDNSRPTYSVETSYTTSMTSRDTRNCSPITTNTTINGMEGDGSGKWKSGGNSDDHNFSMPTDTRSYLISRGLTSPQSDHSSYTNNNTVTSSAATDYSSPTEGILKNSGNVYSSGQVNDLGMDSNGKWKPNSRNQQFGVQPYKNTWDRREDEHGLNALATAVAYVHDNPNSNDRNARTATARSIEIQQEESDAVARAAAAIAAVGQQARQQRQREMRERNFSKGSPHRGPRKQYLSKPPHFLD